MLIFKIENGDIFEGTLEQFEDCFFGMGLDHTHTERVEAIKNWCEFYGYSFESYEQGNN